MPGKCAVCKGIGQRANGGTRRSLRVPHGLCYLPAVGTEPRTASQEPARPLVWCRFGVRKFPFVSLITAGAVGGMFTFLAWLSCSPVMNSAAGFLGLALFWAFCSTVAFAVNEARQMLDAMRSSIAADEGGCRIEWRGMKSYWPYELLGRCRFEGRPVLHAALELRDRTGRAVFEVTTYGEDAEQEASAVASAVSERIEASGRHLGGPLARLGRNGLTAEEWLRALQAEVQAARGNEGFRARNVGWDSLLAAANDVTLSVEDRAGAAYLLARADRPELRDAVRQACKDSWPPLVVAMLAVAVPGPKDELPLDSLEYLDREDIAVLERHASLLETA